MGWGGRGRKGELFFHGYSIYIGDDKKKVLGTDSSDGYTTLQMYLMPPNCTLTNY